MKSKLEFKVQCVTVILLNLLQRPFFLPLDIKGVWCHLMRSLSTHRNALLQEICLKYVGISIDEKCKYFRLHVLILPDESPAIDRTVELFRLEKTSKIKSNQYPSPTTPKPCPACHIYTSFKYCQG